MTDQFSDSSSSSNDTSRQPHHVECGDEDDLCKIGYNDLPFFGFKNYSGLMKVVDIYDGDTCTVVFPYLGKLCKYRARLAFINTPEIHPRKANPDYDQIKQEALEARNRFLYLVLHPESINDLEYQLDVESKDNIQYGGKKLRTWPVTEGKHEIRELLQTNQKLNFGNILGFGKYGRLLLTLHLDSNLSSPLINDILLKENYAVKY